MHTLGFLHEHTRMDRDKYKKINFDNIEESKKNNFRKYNGTQINTYNLPYDYTSIMHYGPKVSY